VRHSPRWKWGLPAVRPFVERDTEKSGEFGGRLNQVSGDFGLSKTICIFLIKTLYPYL